MNSQKPDTLRRKTPEFSDRANRAFTQACKFAERAQSAAEAAELVLQLAHQQILEAANAFDDDHGVNAAAVASAASKHVELATAHATTARSAADAAESEATKAAAFLEPARESVEECLRLLDASDREEPASAAIKTPNKAWSRQAVGKSAVRPAAWQPFRPVSGSNMRSSAEAIACSKAAEQAAKGAELAMKNAHRAADAADKNSKAAKTHATKGSAAAAAAAEQQVSGLPNRGGGGGGGQAGGKGQRARSANGLHGGGGSSSTLQAALPPHPGTLLDRPPPPPPPILPSEFAIQRTCPCPSTSRT